MGNFGKVRKVNQNIVMNEGFVKDIVMNAQIDLQNWWIEQFTARQPKFIGRISG